ncbi:hypothetical protein GCM10029976_055140 [Kribbella albertanoniae]
MNDIDERPLEAQVLAIWSAVLGHSALGLDDDLLDRGMTSLAAIRGLAALRRELGCGLSLDDLLQLRTPRRIAAAQHHADRPIVAKTTDAARKLTDQQQAMVQVIDGRPDTSYLLSDLFELVGPVDGPRLAAALLTLPERHEALRLRVVSPTQGAIARPDDSAVRNAVEYAGDSAVRDLDEIRAHLGRPFRLDADIPFRAMLLRAPDSWILGLATHHIASDAWSHHVLLEDLAIAYHGQTEVPPAPSYWSALAADPQPWAPDLWTDILDRPYDGMRVLAPATGRGPIGTATAPIPGHVDSAQRLDANRLLVAATLRAVSATIGDSAALIGIPFAG